MSFLKNLTRPQVHRAPPVTDNRDSAYQQAMEQLEQAHAEQCSQPQRLKVVAELFL